MTIKIKVKPKGKNDTSESSKNVGTAKVLSGKVFVLSVFVASSSNPWKSTDINRFKQKVFEAERWLKTQALRYGSKVEFINSAYGSDGSFIDDEILLFHDSKGKEADHFLRNVLLKIGYRSDDAFVEWVKNHTACPQCLVVVLSNVEGRCFASKVTKEQHARNPQKYNVESCYIFRRNNTPTAKETTSATIAHEILHLFGAWDLYELDDKDRNRACKTSEMFPDSIMRYTHRDISETQMDEITAWLVGLKQEGKDWYRWFEPRQDSYE